MSTVSFVPAASVEHMEDSRRQLKFKQKANGDVSVKVHFGLSKINTVLQNSIFIERNVVGLRQMGEVTLENSTPTERKNILEAIRLGNAKITANDGVVTEVKKRNSVGFYHEVRSITIILK